VVGEDKGVGAIGVLQEFVEVAGFGDVRTGFGGDGLAELGGGEIDGEDEFAIDVVFDTVAGDEDASGMPLAGRGTEGERRCGKKVEGAGGAGGGNFRVGDAFIVEQLEFETEGLGHIRVEAAGIGVWACTEYEVLDTGVGAGSEIPVKREIEIAEGGLGGEVGAGSVGDGTEGGAVFNGPGSGRDAGASLGLPIAGSE